jgi:hypothetical protein
VWAPAATGPAAACPLPQLRGQARRRPRQERRTRRAGPLRRPPPAQRSPVVAVSRRLRGAARGLRVCRDLLQQRAWSTRRQRALRGVGWRRRGRRGYGSAGTRLGARAQSVSGVQAASTAASRTRPYCASTPPPTPPQALRGRARSCRRRRRACHHGPYASGPGRRRSTRTSRPLRVRRGGSCWKCRSGCCKDSRRGWGDEHAATADLTCAARACELACHFSACVSAEPLTAHRRKPRRHRGCCRMALRARPPTLRGAVARAGRQPLSPERLLPAFTRSRRGALNVSNQQPLSAGDMADTCPTCGSQLSAAAQLKPPPPDVLAVLQHLTPLLDAVIAGYAMPREQQEAYVR